MTVCRPLDRDTRSEPQIREGTEDNSKVFFLISQRKHAVALHWNRRDETVVMMRHNIRLKGVMWELSLNYPFTSF